MTYDVEAWLVGKMAERMVQLKAEHDRVAGELLAFAAELSAGDGLDWLRPSPKVALLENAARLLRGEPGPRPPLIGKVE